jgi:glycerol-3-phosphate acyltransferase PlsY
MPVGIFITLFGYLLGSVPTGIVLTRLFSKTDPRKSGSKNIGATNIYRTSGKTLGILTLAGDMLKGVIPIWMAILWAQHDLWGVPDLWIAVVGLSPMVGHIFPIFLGFKGGKGVATALGVYLVISPVAVLIESLIFILIVWKWRIISLGSILCAITIPVFIALFRNEQAYFILSVIIAGLILYRHQSNIARLIQGTENKWKA